MKRFLQPLWRLIGQGEEVDDEYGAFDLGQEERREMILDLQLETFRHLAPHEVRWVTSWALTLSECTDDQLLRAWMEAQDA